MPRSPYALGFTTLEREVRLGALPLHGMLPPWLTGTLVRTGPAKFEVDGQAYNHWFDGLAMLLSFSFAGGRVAYANRFLRTGAFCEAQRQGRVVRSEFATDPCRTLFGRVAALFSPKPIDNANVSIQVLAGQAVALTETPLPVRFDPETLETLGIQPTEDTVRGQISIAHPHLDFERGCHYSYLLEMGRRSTYHLYRLPFAGGPRELIASVPAEKPSYMHSFGMTERFLVLAEFPLVVNPLRLALRSKPFIRNYRWEAGRGVRLHVVDKESGERVHTASGNDLFAFHHVNAFEQDGALWVDVVAYPDASIIDQLYLEPLRAGALSQSAGQLTRLRVPLQEGAGVTSQVISGTAIELPRIDYRRAGRPYRYVYGAGSAVRGNFLDCLVKLDLDDGKTVTWAEEGCYPGEPVHVAAPDTDAEGGGVILSVVLDARRDNSFLLILDAASYRELARAEVPHHIPFGFHGNYLAETRGPGAVRTLHQ